jgi:hypothetical protein
MSLDQVKVSIHGEHVGSISSQFKGESGAEPAEPYHEHRVTVLSQR